MASFIDAKGQTQQLPIDLGVWRSAFDAGMSLPQFLNANFEADARHGSTWQQVLASEGIFVKPNKEFGIRPSTLADIFDGPKVQAGGTVIRDAVPTSRYIWPAVILEAIENKLVANMEMTANAFDSMIAVDDSIQSDRYERPILDFSKPEKGMSKPTAQLAEPDSVLSITASDVSRKIPGFALKLEISDQAAKATSLDLVTLAIARQAAVERNLRANAYIAQLWNGDTDFGQSALSSISGKVLTARTDLDTSISGAGALSQKAWMKWLFNNSAKRTITHIVCDIDTAMLIENRSGKPVVVGDNPTSARIDTVPQVMNPAWPDQVKVFLVDRAAMTTTAWPTNQIMGIDARYAIHRVRSLIANYQSIEAFVTRRSTVLRIDFGEFIERLFDDAFEGLLLA